MVEAVLPRIRRFHIRVSLDGGIDLDIDAVTATFSGKDELTIEAWHSPSTRPNYMPLQVFEEVRGVKAAKIIGNIHTFDKYAKWLASTMEAEPGHEPPDFDHRWLTSRHAMFLD
jgi:hypothetical protein